MIAPPAVTDSAPVMEMVPSTIALVSTRVRFSPLAMPTAPVKSLVAVSRVTLLPAPGLKEVVPVMASAPLSVMAPEVVTLKRPTHGGRPQVHRPAGGEGEVGG